MKEIVDFVLNAAGLVAGIGLVGCAISYRVFKNYPVAILFFWVLVIGACWLVVVLFGCIVWEIILAITGG